MLSISNEGRILIVGSRKSNFTDDLLNHPRLVFWHNSDNRANRGKSIPKGVEAVIFTPHISDSFAQKIRETARRAGVNFSRHIHNTGEIKRIIAEQILEAAPVRVTAEPAREAAAFAAFPTEATSTINAPGVTLPVPTETALKPTETGRNENMGTGTRKKGALTSIIQSQANLSASSIREEAERIVKLAEAEGINTTLDSVKSMLYQTRKKKTTSGKRPKKRNASRRLRKDSLRVIEKFLSQFELVGVAVREIIEINQLLQEENAALKKKVQNFIAAGRAFSKAAHS